MVKMKSNQDYVLKVKNFIALHNLDTEQKTAAYHGAGLAKSIFCHGELGGIQVSLAHGKAF